MNKILLILSLIVTTVFANPQVIVFDKKIYDKYQNWAKFKNEEKSTITFDKDRFEKYLIWEKLKKETGENISFNTFNNTQKIVKNCTEYLKYYKNYNLATDSDHRKHSQYLDCEILDHIQNAEVEYQENSNIDYANYLYNVINIKSFANSLNPKYKVGHITLHKIFNNVSKKDNLLLEINEKNWHYHFHVIGIEKKDNKQYLLVYFLDEALKSSYYSESFLILDYKQPNIQKEKEEKSFFSKLLKWFGFSKFNKKINIQYC